MKIKALIVTSALVGLFFSNITLAGSAADSMGSCMSDAMTGKERKEIAQWLFFAIAAHPQMKEFSKITEDSQKNSNILVAKLLTRLLTENCPEQAKMAIKEGGSEAMKTAFRFVGSAAMQELLTNKEVTTYVSGFEQYVDREKMNAVFSGK